MPALPPESVSVVELPAQMVVVPLMDVGAVDAVFTVTVAEAQVVVLQVPE